jgi:hypothetical protein
MNQLNKCTFLKRIILTTNKEKIDMQLNLKITRLSDEKEFFPTKIEMNSLGHCNGEIQYLEAREKNSIGGEYEIIRCNLTMNKQIKKFEEQFKIEIYR